jgi:polysaccharide export outer membrane protein
MRTTTFWPTTNRTLWAGLSLAILLSILSFWPPEAFAQEEERPLTIIDYRIGAKDLLEIAVFGLPELNQTVRVAEDGSITLSLLGKVEVAGLTAQELEKKLASLLDQQYTKGSNVTVFIKEYQKVAVNGAVGRPGLYELVGPTTLLQIIAQAGGLTTQVMNELYIYRQGQDGQNIKISIDLTDLINGGNQDLDILLQPKDSIIIPVDQTLSVYVYGQVRNPGVIQFQQSKRITLLQAIAQAGGTTEWAKSSRVLIKRKNKKTGNEMKIPINLKNLIKGKISDIVLEEGDVVIVP